MFEIDYRFNDESAHWQEKIQLIAYVYGVSVEYVQNEVSALCNTQIKESRMWDYIVNQILNSRKEDK